MRHHLAIPLLVFAACNAPKPLAPADREAVIEAARVEARQTVEAARTEARQAIDKELRDAVPEIVAAVKQTIEDEVGEALERRVEQAAQRALDRAVEKAKQTDPAVAAAAATGDPVIRGLRRGLSIPEVLVLLGGPRKVEPTSSGGYRWYYSEFSYIEFDRKGLVTDWRDSDYDRTVSGFRGFPVQLILPRQREEVEQGPEENGMDLGQVLLRSALRLSPAASPPASTTSVEARALPTVPGVAENGSYYGELNAAGRPKTVHVRGYYRKDGTYVRGHYRSRPRR